MKQTLAPILLIVAIIHLLSACSVVINDFTNNLDKAVKASDDPQTVAQALPAYLIFMDGLLEGDPEDEDVLLASSKLMGAYAALIGADIEMMGEIEEEETNYSYNKVKQQQKKITKKALDRAALANCLYDENLCDLVTLKYSEFEKRILQIDEDDIAMIYGLGTAWAAWLQVNSDDWNATAKIPQITLIMKRVIEIEENWDNAGAYMYMGVLNSVLPKAYGGKPEIGRVNFEKAINLTKGKNLMAKVLYAEFYARLTFNQDLHDRLINEVLNFSEHPKKYILINTLAIEKAKALRISADDYF